MKASHDKETKSAPKAGQKRKATQQAGGAPSQAQLSGAKNGAHKRKKVDNETNEREAAGQDSVIKDEMIKNNQGVDSEMIDQAPMFIENEEQVLRRNEKLIVVKQQNDNQDIKWNSLEHRGVTFESRYEPHGVKLLYNVSERLC